MRIQTSVSLLSLVSALVTLTVAAAVPQDKSTPSTTTPSAPLAKAILGSWTARLPHTSGMSIGFPGWETYTFRPNGTMTIANNYDKGDKVTVLFNYSLHNGVLTERMVSIPDGGTRYVLPSPDKRTVQFKARIQCDTLYLQEIHSSKGRTYQRVKP